MEFLFEFLFELLMELVFAVFGTALKWLITTTYRWLSLPMRPHSKSEPFIAYSSLAMLGLLLGWASLFAFDHRLSKSDFVSTAALFVSPAVAALLVNLARRVDPNRREDDPIFMTGRGTATFVFFFVLARYYFLVFDA